MHIFDKTCPNQRGLMLQAVHHWCPRILTKGILAMVVAMELCQVVCCALALHAIAVVHLSNTAVLLYKP